MAKLNQRQRRKLQRYSFWQHNWDKFFKQFLDSQLRRAIEKYPHLQLINGQLVVHSITLGKAESGRFQSSVPNWVEVSDEA